MTEPDRGIDTTKGSLGVISDLFSSECFCGRNNFLKDNSYIFSTAPLDCVTIPYYKVLGTSSTDPTIAGTDGTIVINGNNVTPSAHNIVKYGTKKYVWREDPDNPRTFKWFTATDGDSSGSLKIVSLKNDLWKGGEGNDDKIRCLPDDIHLDVSVNKKNY